MSVIAESLSTSEQNTHSQEETLQAPLDTNEDTVLIPLCDEFQYLHGPLYNQSNISKARKDETQENDQFFIGRDKIVHSLYQLLLGTKDRRGCYLVAGYRGVGKTSVINKVLNLYANEVTQKSPDNKKVRPKRPVIVRVNIGHNTGYDVDDIFFNILTVLHRELERNFPEQNSLLYKIKFNKYFTDKRVVKLKQRLSYIVKKENLSSLTANLSAGIKPIYASKVDSKLQNSQTKTSLPLGSREIEIELMSILDDLRDATHNALDVIFVFDEIDKLSAHDDISIADASILNDELGDVTIRTQNRKQKLDYLLGILKNFITTARARFIFAAGREALDAYNSEMGSTGSLYESVFDQVFEVPSLLTDPSDGRKPILSSMIEAYVCSRILGSNEIGFLHSELIHGNYNDNSGEKSYEDYTISNYYKFVVYNYSTEFIGPQPDDYDEFKDPAFKGIRYSTYVLRNFINYLAFQTWGNPKRLAATFESFIKTTNKTKHSKEKHYLEFKVHDQKRFFLASEIYTLFQHHLSRQVMQTSDKLTVSSLSALHFILKFYPYGFTRDALYRMEEVINVHRPPEINNIIDSLLSQVLRSYLRRVRNGTFRYRFNSGFEQEIRYISFMDNVESAAFNFSLDGMNAVKRYFKNILRINELNISESVLGYAKTSLILGDINSYEQNYDIASEYYSNCVTTLHNKLIDKEGNILSPKNLNEEIFLLFIETIIKNGDLEECRSNYNRAAANYTYALKIVSSICDLSKSNDNTSLNLKKDHLKLCILDGDSKLDILKQPVWLTQFLKLKRGPSSLDESKFVASECFYTDEDPRFDFRKAELQFFLLDFSGSSKSYCNVYKKSNDYGHKLDQERKAYLTAYSIIYKVDSKLCRLSRRYWYALRKGFSREKTTLYPLHIIKKYIDLLKSAADTLEMAGLYNHAGLTYIRMLGYISIGLDYIYYNQGSSGEGDINENDINTIKTWLHDFSRLGFEMINASREVSSSHTVDTWLARDISPTHEKHLTIYENKKKYVSIIDILINYDKDNPQFDFIDEKPFWHHSLMGQKLVVFTLWNIYSQNRVLSNYDDLLTKLNVNSVIPFSTHFNIFYRWLVIRKDLTEFRENIQNQSMITPEQYTKASTIAYTIYSAIIDHRQLSNNHQTLISPLISQIYYLQWELLLLLIDGPADVYDRRQRDDRRKDFRGSDERRINNKSRRKNSIVDFEPERRRKFNKSKYIMTRVSFVQKRLLQLQPNENEMPPSHCDLFQVTDKTRYHLKNTECMFDKTARTRKDLLQKKYYLHDDYSDPEFRLDWTLLHMFIPRAWQMNVYLTTTMNELLKDTKFTCSMR